MTLKKTLETSAKLVVGLTAVGAAVFGGLAVAVVPVHAGPAVGQFEVKDLEAEPGRVEFQSQNAHSFGQPRRRSAFDADDNETLYDDNSVARQRHALELETALTRFFRVRIGVEFEKERVEEPDFPADADSFEVLRLDEVALEGVLIVVPVPKTGGVGFGLLGEFEAPTFSDDLKTIIFGPIFEAVSGRWRLISNFTFVHSFGKGESGEDDEGGPDRKWDLAYANQLSYELTPAWTLALEAYGTFDRLGDTGQPGKVRAFFGDHDQHRVGPIAYYRFDVPGRGGAGQTPAAAHGLDDDGEGEEDEGTSVSIGAGVLFGLNENTPDTTLKWSVEVEF